MAWNLNRIISVGRRASRMVRQVQRARRRGVASSGTRTHTPTAAQSRSVVVGSQGGVPDYPGDFHGTAQVAFSPVPGPQAGPGEVVWTWVPYEELDGRGKDRPVLIVGRHGDYLLGAQLTTRDRSNGHDRGQGPSIEHLDIGSGPWDSTGRPSEVKLGRILQINPRDVRREGGVLRRATFERVAQALRRVNGWA